MLKGVNQWCFPAMTPLEQVLTVSADAGYDAVELNLYEPGGVGFTLDTTAAEAEKIGALARRFGVQLRSLSTGLMGKTPLSSADPAVRERGRAVVVKQLELAQLVGIDTVLVVPGRVDANHSYSDVYERSQAELRMLAEEAERRQVHIAVENVWNKFLLSPLEAARYVDEIGSPRVNFYFDVGNVLLFGFPEQWIRISGPRIVKAHVKDYKPGVGTGQGFVPLLAGDVNWAAVRAAFQEIGYTDTLTAEISPYTGNPLQAVYDTARHLDLIISGKAFV